MSNFANNNNMTALFTAIGTKLGKRPPNFIGTLEEWNALSESEKAKYKTVDTPEGDGRSVDNTPTEDSDNLVTSGGVFSAIKEVSDEVDTKVSRSQITNINLLDNSWFIVNQRGFTTGVLTASQYTVDRWRVVGPTGQTVTVDNNGVTIDNSNGSNDVYFLQRKINTELEFAHLLGEKVTGSVLLSNGTILSGTVTLSTSANTYYEDDTIKIYTNVNDNEFFSIQVKAGNSFTIRAAKLEMGDISTLIHEDALTISDEVYKCYRYYQTIKTSNDPILVGLMLATSTTQGRVVLYLRSAFNQYPTFSSSNIQVQEPGGNAISVTLNLISVLQNIANIGVTGSGFTVGKMYLFQIKANGNITFDAEL